MGMTPFYPVSDTQNISYQFSSKGNLNFEKLFAFDGIYYEISQDVDEQEIEDIDSEFSEDSIKFSFSFSPKQPDFYCFLDRNKKTNIPLYLLYCNLKIAICC